VISKMKTSGKAYFVIGLAIALVAALLMVNGHILGEDTPGYAIVLGIIGIGLIAGSRK
jgi:hypothetical protein